MATDPAAHQHPTFPFLKLPSELRNRIYSFALVKPTPIDLCPGDSVYDASNMKYKIQNIPSLGHFNSPTLHEELEIRQKYLGHLHTFRVQKDLLWVRKELSPKLLRTCRQIYGEASEIFWSANKWQFAQDKQWHTLFRWLKTIGPRAIARIRSLEVFAPMASDPMEGHGLAALDPEPSKNHPKLRMAKIPHEGCCDCRAETFKSLMLEGTLRFNFVVPAGFCICTLDEYGNDMHGSDDSQVPRRKSLVPQGFLPKITITIEPYAFAQELKVKDFTGRGWDLIAAPDSTSDYMADFFTNRSIINPTNTMKTWKGLPRKL
ncbi:MAG: hypothetical protein Q9170_001735 [Blastenia crenularia]